MIEPRENAALGVKPLQKKRLREAAADDLDRHQLLELVIVARAKIDDAHAAMSELADDAIRAASRGERLRCVSRLRGVRYGLSSRGVGEYRRVQEVAGAIVRAEQRVQLREQLGVIAACLHNPFRTRVRR